MAEQESDQPPEQRDRLELAREALEGHRDIEAVAHAVIDIAESLRTLTAILPVDIQNAITQGLWEGRSR